MYFLSLSLSLLLEKKYCGFCFFFFFIVSHKSHVCAELLQSCPTLCNHMDDSPPGSSVHGILQARVLEWVAMPSSRRSSWARDKPTSLKPPALAGRFFTFVSPGKPCKRAVSVKGRMEIRSILGAEWMELWADSVSHHFSSIPSPVGTELPIFTAGALLPLACFSHQVYHPPHFHFTPL